ncbi:MAG TPA: hypothetical protein VF376_06910 [Thermoanaerobaculia bacterium]
MVPSVETSTNGRRHPYAISGLLVFLTVLILVRGLPVLTGYARWFLARHGRAEAALAVSASIGILCLLFVGLWKQTRATATVGGLIALVLVVTSGNAGALLMASTLWALTLLAGDWISRLFRGREAEKGELAISIAAGSAALGGCLLLLGEAGLARPLPLTGIGFLLVLARRRRIPRLSRLVLEAGRHILNHQNSAIESVWLAIVGVTIAACFLGALCPDVSPDALAYHLPEVRDFAERGRVVPLDSLYETLPWRNYETYLGAAYLAGGERVVQLLHFLIGLSVLAAAVALGRRLASRDSSALILLGFAAFPLACGQLKVIYVDLTTALLLTASAVEIAASKREPRRIWLAGFLFGGAVATKIFALLGAGALLILLIRRQRGSPRRLLAFALFAALPLLPWFAWSQSTQGFFLSPYSHPWLQGWSRPVGEVHIPERPQGEVRQSGVFGFFRLLYGQTFPGSRFISNGGSFIGFLPPLLLLGAFGWGGRGLGLFCGAALAALLPWYLLSSARVIAPTIRYLVPVYPLFAVFAAVGLMRLTDDFQGRSGAVAAVSIAILSIALPVQLFSTTFDAKVAIGLVSREEALAAYLPDYPLWKHVAPNDRVLLLGNSDRYHCPAEYMISLSVLKRMNQGSGDWRDALRRLRITRIVRVDERYNRKFMESLGRCVEIVDRHANAILYRVSWESGDCSEAKTSGSPLEIPGKLRTEGRYEAKQLERATGFEDVAFSRNPEQSRRFVSVYAFSVSERLPGSGLKASIPPQTTPSSPNG